PRDLVYRGGQPQIGIKQGAPARRDQGRKRPTLSRMRRVHQPGAEPERSREPRKRELGLDCKTGQELRSAS
ncbi:MAG TPA: hypothetical protein VMT20_23795, partial [Terriglobia bacterium]|nr:hypothetical protein [Terriglobia bacterium]